MEMTEENLIPAQNAGEQVIEQNPLLQFTDELTETKITEKLKQFNSTWDAFSAELYPKMKQWLTMYRAMDHTVEGVSTKIPEVFTLVETQLPHLLNSIFSQSNVINATPKFNDPDGAKTYKIKSFINNLIKDRTDGRRKSELVIKNMLIYGWSVVKMYWNTTPDKDIDPITKEVVNINSAHPDFYLVDPFAFAFDPNYDGQKIDEIEWVRERIFINKDKLKQIRDNGECGPFEDDELESGEGQDKGREARKKNTNQEKGRNKTYYDEFWCTFYSKDSEGKLQSNEYRVWFLANNKIIKFEINEFKFKPFTITRAYSNPNEFLGQGESEIVGALANQLSYTHFQSGKMVKKVGQNLTFIDPSAGISPQNLKRIEQGVLFVNNLNGIKSEQSTDPQNIQVLVKYKEYLDSQLEKITGVGPTLQGEVQGDITATQASIVNQNASNRLANKLTHLQEDFIVPLAEVFFLMNKQLLQDPIQFFDSNNNLIELTPEDFNGNYNWTANGTINQSNKALQLQQNMQQLQSIIQAAQASNNPQISAQPFTVDIPYYIEAHLAPYAQIPDINNVIKLTPIPQQQGPAPQLPPQGQAPSPVNNPTPTAPPQGNSAPIQSMPTPVNVQPIQPRVIPN